MSAAPQDAPSYRGLTPPAREQVILKLHAEGKSDYQIAEACGVNRRVIYDVRHKHRLPANGAVSRSRPRQGASASYVKVWKPSPQAETPASPPLEPWNIDEPDRTHGWQAPDGRWWTGGLRADKGPLLTQFASYAKPQTKDADISAVLRRLGFKPGADGEKQAPPAEWWGLSLKPLEEDA